MQFKTICLRIMVQLIAFRFDPKMPMHEEPKFIVFCSKLLQLFTMFCFCCQRENPSVKMWQNGTMITVLQKCRHCSKGFRWRSQPFTLGRHPAGNMLLSFGTLLAGGSVSKILLIMRHMGLCAYRARTFFSHQRNFLFPAILCYWETYQEKLLRTIRITRDLSWSEDGRFDSMGHSAKYGSYTMFCSSIMKIVHFELLQVSFDFNC